MEESPHPSIDVVLQEMREQRCIQDDSIQALDAKTGTLAGFLGVLLALVVGKLYFEHPLEALLSTLCLVGFVGALLSAIRGFSVKDWRYDPSPDVLLEDYLFRHPTLQQGGKAGSKAQIVADQREAYRRNQGVLLGKAKQIQGAMQFLFVGVLCFLGQYFYPQLVWLLRNLCRLCGE